MKRQSGKHSRFASRRNHCDSGDAAGGMHRCIGIRSQSQIGGNTYAAIYLCRDVFRGSINQAEAVDVEDYVVAGGLLFNER